MKKLLFCVSLLIISPVEAGLHASLEPPRGVALIIFDSILTYRGQTDFGASAIFDHPKKNSRPDFSIPLSTGFEIDPPGLHGLFSTDQKPSPIIRSSTSDKHVSDPHIWFLPTYLGWLPDGGSDFIDAVPAPGAFILGGLGVGLIGWLRRHRTL